MLNLSPTSLDSSQPESSTSSATSSSSSESSSEMSIDGSCVSSEAEQDQVMSSPDQMSLMNTTRVMSAPMVLAGCPRCLMYVMLSDTNPKCPKCNSTVLIDFLNEDNKKTGT